MWPTLVIFAATYVLIAGRRLTIIPIGRPAGALVGACAMVGLSLVHPGGLLPAEAFAAVDANTIGLLLGMMLLAGAIAEVGLFDRAAIALEGMAPARLLWVVTIGSGVASALLLNDSICLLLAPVVDRTARRSGYARTPFLLALAMGANAGSAMTLAGNPQNMLVGQLSGISYTRYLLRAGPAGALALITTAAVVHLIFRSTLSGPGPGDGEPPRSTRVADAPETSRERAGIATWAPVVCLAGLSVAFLAGANLAWSALAAAAVVILLQGRDPDRLFSRVSWTVLVFFAALFVLVAGLQKAAVPQRALEALAPHLPESATGALVTLSAVVMVACQTISNVPFILLAEPLIRSFADVETAWITVAVISTLAGNLTILGSVANIIVVETAGAEALIGFRAYARAGVPVTLGSVAVALAWILATR